MKKRLFFLFQLMLLSIFSFGQTSGQCWDFEEGCSSPQNAFVLGCIPNAISISGQPGNENFLNVGAFSGSKYATLYTNYCWDGPGKPAYARGDGFALQYNFVSGTTYTINFALWRFEGGTTEFKLVATNGRNNFSDPFPQFPCTSVGAIPAINAGDLTLATYSASTMPSNGWVQKSVTFTPTSNFTQLWFRPKTMGEFPGQAPLDGHLLIDKVCITNPCIPVQHTVTVCRYNGSSEVVATINGVNVPAGEWTLGTAISCTGGSGIGNLGSVLQNINWLVSGSSFSVPTFSGCYILYRMVSLCHQPPQFVGYLFNAGEDGAGLPVCNGPCDDWHISKILEPETIQFSVINSPPSSGFPVGSTFTFSIDGIMLQSGTSQIFEIDPLAYSSLPHEMCVIVRQSGCPAIQKCIIFKGFGEPQNRSSVRTNIGANLKISNPSSGSIWLSIALEGGEARLYSVQGSLVKTFELNDTNNLDVSELTSGQYFLKINTADLSVSKLVIIHN